MTGMTGTTGTMERAEGRDVARNVFARNVWSLKPKGASATQGVISKPGTIPPVRAAPRKLRRLVCMGV